eukprot:1156114-Pyramimonas_sp.AAC.1
MANLQTQLAKQPQRTKLSDGKTILLFDPSSKINVASANAAALECDGASFEWTGKVSTRAARPRLI